MSIAKKKLPWSRAAQLAQNLLSDLEPSCERIEVAGSIRRRKPEVGDVELVAVPRVESAGVDLYGGSCKVRPLDDTLTLMVNRGYLVVVKGFKPGQPWKMSQFRIKHADCNLDLFLTTPEQWGLILAIRTGPENFSRLLVTPRKRGGYLPSHMKVKDGWLRAGDKRIETPTEEELFRVLGMESIVPEKRA